MKPFDFQKYLKNNPLLKESVNEGPLGKLGNLTDEQEVELAKKAAEEVFRNWKKITGYTDPNDPKSDPVKYSKLTDVGVRANGEDWDYPKGVYNFLKQKPYNYVDIGIFNGEFTNLLDAAEDSQSVNEAPAGGDEAGMIDKVIKANYPGANKIDSDLEAGEGYEDIACYAVDPIGDKRFPTVKVCVAKHIASGRVFVYELNDNDEPQNDRGESNGEIVNGQLDREEGRESELDY